MPTPTEPAALAAGDIVALNEHTLRTRLAEDVSGVFGGSAFIHVSDLKDGESVASALKQALQQQLTRVIDLFKEWDANKDGKISKKECAAQRGRWAWPLAGALPLRLPAQRVPTSMPPMHSHPLSPFPPLLGCVGSILAL
jgi:hypothetical protein